MLNEVKHLEASWETLRFAHSQSALRAGRQLHVMLNEVKHLEASRETLHFVPGSLSTKY